MKKKISISFILCIFLIGNAVGVFAATQYKEVKALFYPGVKVELNGQEANSIKALKYEGSLYISVKSMSEYFGLDSTLKYDSKNNKVTIGGPKYVNISDSKTKNFYQVIVNGNWNSSIQTNSRQMLSNYYMGIDINLDIQSETTIDEYYKNLLKNEYKDIKVSNEVNTKISNAEAKIVDYTTTDSIGKLAVIHKDSDFVTLFFFVDKTRFKETDIKEYEKIINSFNIQ
ncbi:hypothetical protein [Paenibacillus wynnii]|uniref:hypothetical protein n=1 Tax=Paenibacillus wynnii TaxID=268407 RepID=UPI00278CDD96|nr:hypothetical protein [Paenibacillus wynnii]MDQ0193804.1 hypothetical protein [Paenibacillus wynnii]